MYYDDDKKEILKFISQKTKAKPVKHDQNKLKEEINKEPIFCICKKPDDNTRPMIECESCSDWFHFDCIGLNPVHLINYRTLFQTYIFVLFVNKDQRGKINSIES